MTGNLVKFARAAPFVGFPALAHLPTAEEEESKRARVLGYSTPAFPDASRSRFASRVTNRSTSAFSPFSATSLCEGFIPKG